MTGMKHNRIYLDPTNIDDALQKLALVYDLDADTLEMLRRIVPLYPRPVTMIVDEAQAIYYSQAPLIDKFTFNIQSDELMLFSRDPMTFIDAMIEMAMYVAGFSTMMGVDEYWKTEFTIGAWKPVKNRVKRTLRIPVLDEPLWVVGLPPSTEEGWSDDDPHPFRTLVSQLDIASFTQMVRLAARDDVEVQFPSGADPRVIDVYIRVKNDIYQVADGLLLDGWREFNSRLLTTVSTLEDRFQPSELPMPSWWRDVVDDLNNSERPPRLGQDGSNMPDIADSLPIDEDSESFAWNPFQAYLDELLSSDQ